MSQQMKPVIEFTGILMANEELVSLIKQSLDTSDKKKSFLMDSIIPALNKALDEKYPGNAFDIVFDAREYEEE